MLGYKVAKNGDTRVIVTLEIPTDARTNMNRLSVAVKEYATYRTDKAKVVKIEDVDGNTYTSAESIYYPYATLYYTAGEMVEEPSFGDPSQEDGDGIYFFLKRERADTYGIHWLEDGQLTSWYENGNKEYEVAFVDGLMDGFLRRWSSNGLKTSDIRYENGKATELHREGCEICYL